MKDKEYNGWTNYETWRIQLEVFDGQELTDFFDPSGMEKDDVDIRDIASLLEDHIVSYLEESGKGLVLDLAMSFISNVDFEEIAKHMINDHDWE